MPINIERWGKDHWSTLAYVETCCVDNKVEDTKIGRLNQRRMRCNPHTHPLLAHLPGWSPDHGTRLKGFQSPKETPELLLPDHDDWDCIDDMEAEGLAVIHSLVNFYVELTDEGLNVAAQLRIHKAQGGNFADFEPVLTREADDESPATTQPA